jgi:hypothetical protein
MTTDRAGAVVTLCDANYYPGLRALHASVQSSTPCDLLCYDAGLTAEQLADAARVERLHVLPLPDDRMIGRIVAEMRQSAPLSKLHKRIWPLWICPLLIRAAPARDVIWLDCDILVLRGLDELFAMLEDGPVFTPENKAPELAANDPRLYELLPIARPFDMAAPVVNGGVSAWRHGRDDEAIDAYVRPVAEAVRSTAVRDAIAWHDQGALIWAIQSLGLEHRVLPTPQWNLSVDRAPLDRAMLVWDDGLLARLREALPEVRLLHWNGRPVPWLDEIAASR